MYMALDLFCMYVHDNNKRRKLCVFMIVIRG